MRTYEIVVQRVAGWSWEAIDEEYSAIAAAVDLAAATLRLGQFYAVGVRPIGDYKSPLIWLDVNSLADVKGGVPCVAS